ncbi:MAG TPA: hypothetical protein P5081_00040 [Phycisphaerae bacterium]|nr:hypothetical protein [Phycisphaerae bacterium]HRW51242.1 hypothetical protein [Phycisphaerae bacterium]
MFIARSAIQRCPQCDYDIHMGVADGRCPECGLRLDISCCMFRRAPVAGDEKRESPYAIFGLAVPLSLSLFVVLPIRISLGLIVLTWIGAVLIFIYSRKPRNTAPMIILDRNGVSFGAPGRVRFIPWVEVQRIRAADLSAYVKTSRVEPIWLPACFTQAYEWKLFDAMAERLRNAPESGEVIHSDDLFQECLPLSLPREVKPEPQYLPQSAASAIYLYASTGVAGALTIWNIYYGLFAFLVLGGIAATYLAVRAWKSDEIRKKPGNGETTE